MRAKSHTWASMKSRTESEKRLLEPPDRTPQRLWEFSEPSLKEGSLEAAGGVPAAKKDSADNTADLAVPIGPQMSTGRHPEVDWLADTRRKGCRWFDEPFIKEDLVGVPEEFDVTNHESPRTPVPNHWGQPMPEAPDSR